MQAEQVEGRGEIDADTGDTLQIRLLGPPRWMVGDRQSAFPDPRASVLIAMVALDGPLPRNQAADMFWPRSEGAARTNLRVLLHRLKQAVGVPLFASGDRLALLPDVVVDVAAGDSEIVEHCLQLGASSLRLLHGVEFDELPEVSTWLDCARFSSISIFIESSSWNCFRPPSSNCSAPSCNRCWTPTNSTDGSSSTLNCESWPASTMNWSERRSPKKTVRRSSTAFSAELP